MYLSRHRPFFPPVQSACALQSPAFFAVLGVDRGASLHVCPDARCTLGVALLVTLPLPAPGASPELPFLHAPAFDTISATSPSDTNGTAERMRPPSLGLCSISATWVCRGR